MDPASLENSLWDGYRRVFVRDSDSGLVVVRDIKCYLLFELVPAFIKLYLNALKPDTFGASDHKNRRDWGEIVDVDFHCFPFYCGKKERSVIRGNYIIKYPAITDGILSLSDKLRIWIDIVSDRIF